VLCAAANRRSARKQKARLNAFTTTFTFTSAVTTVTA